MEVIIEIHKIEKKYNEKNISNLKNHIEFFFAQIEELKNENDFNQRLKNQDIKKEIKYYKA